MSSILSTLKVKFSADTSELKKGADEGKAAIKGMTSEAGGALDSFASLFGVNMRGMSEGAASFKNVVGGMRASFSGAASGSGIFTKALGVLKGAIISTGIGALIVLLGSLIAYFTTTGEGADKFNQIMSAMGAAFRVVTDQLIVLGQWLIAAFSNPKESIKDLWEFIKSQFVNRITALPKLVEAAWNAMRAVFSDDVSMKDAMADMGTALTQLGTGLDEVQQQSVINYFGDVGKEMGNAAKQAYALQGQLEALEDQERALNVVASEREKQIKALRLVSTDETRSTEERLAANKKAMSLELQNLADRKKIAAEEVRILKDKLAIRGEDKAKDDELDQVAEAQVRLNEIESESLVTQKKLQSEYNNLAESIKKKTDALIADRKKQDEYLQPIKTQGQLVQPELADGTKLKASYMLDVVPSVDMSKIIPDTKAAFEGTKNIIQANLDASTAGLHEFFNGSKAIIVDVSEEIDGCLTGIAVGMSETIGQMMVGMGDLSSIGDLAISGLAETMIAIGKIIVAAGIAFFHLGESFQAALTNPASALLAVAAGAALIAVGSAVKSSLSSAASGGGSSGISSASSPVTSVDTRNSSNTSQSNTASIAVEVTGEFKQRGSDLVAVVAKENNRKTLTT